MAERRMFTKKVTDDDNFMSLSSSAQALYLHLSMSADDDGFSNQVAISMFKAHASVQDLEALLNKRYIYQFENGVIVIKHWRMANALRKDRYTPTAFKEELAQLHIKENGSYTMNPDGCQMVADWLPDGCQVVAERLPQVRIGKDRKGKESIGKERIEDVCSEPQSASEPEAETAVLILNDGSGWRPTVKDYEEWCKVYPNVDVFHELERMRQWCLSNPTKRKTIKGIRRFVTTWLDGEQNKPRKAASKLDAMDQWAENMKRRNNEESGIF